MSQHVLSLGGLILSEKAPTEHPEGFTFEVEGEDMDLGSPVPVEVVLSSMLTDGSLVRRTRDDNREATFRVAIIAGDSEGLARGELALASITNRPTALAWTPPDGWGETAVFDVQTSSMTHLFDDMSEVLRRRRVYQVRVVSLPYARRPTKTVVPAMATGTPRMLDACDSTAGWSAASGRDGAMTPVVVSLDTAVKVQGAGALRVTVPATSTSSDYDDGVMRTWFRGVLTKALDVADRFVTITVRMEGLGLPLDRYTIRGRSATGATWRVESETWHQPAANWLRVVLDRGADAGSAASMSIDVALTAPGAAVGAAANVWIDDISQSPTLPSGHQAARIIEVGGSARTAGSISVQHSAPQGLGDVLVATYPDKGRGWRPDLRRGWVRPDGITPAVRAGAINGATIPSTSRFRIPAASMPAGGYVIMARVYNPGAAMTRNATWQADVAFDPTSLSVAGLAQSGSQRITVGASGFTVVTLGAVTLPPADLPARSTASVDLQIALGVEIDEAWLFYLGDGGALTHVKAGEATQTADPNAMSRIWIESASTDRTTRAVWAGTRADQSDARFATLQSWSDHVLEPGQNAIFVVTTGLPGAEVGAEFYERFHTHPTQGAA